MTDYANNWQLRQEMIWKAVGAINSTAVKNAPMYIARMTERYGTRFPEAVKIAYDVRQFCYAVQIDKIDAALSSVHGWKTIQQFRA